MVNILLLEQNGGIKTIKVDDNLKKDDLQITSYTKNAVKLTHKWKLSTILPNVKNDLSLNIYTKSKFKSGLEINKHDLPPPLHNLDNVYYGNILVIGLDDSDNVINFDKDHWGSLVKILNKEEDDDEDDEDEDEEEEDEDDDDFIVNSSEESDLYEEEEDNNPVETINEYEQIIGKQTVTIFRLRRRIKELEKH